MVARTSGATAVHPEQSFHTVFASRPEYYLYARREQKAQLGLRLQGQRVVTFAEVDRLRGNHDPDPLIREDYKTLFNAAAKVAARSGCKPMPHAAQHLRSQS